MAADVLYGWELIYRSVEDDIKYKSDVIIAFIHWILTKKGFRCIVSELQGTFSGGNSELLVNGWCNKKYEDYYGLQYAFENERFTLHGVPTGPGFNFILTFMRSADLALSSIAVKVNDTVENLYGSINEIMPNHMEFIHKINRDLIDTVTGKPIANRETQTSESSTMWLPVDSLTVPPRPERTLSGENLGLTKEIDQMLSRNLSNIGTPSPWSLASDCERLLNNLDENCTEDFEYAGIRGLPRITQHEHIAMPADQLYYGWGLIYKTVEEDVKCKPDVIIAFIHWILTKKGFRCIVSEPKGALSGDTSELLVNGWNSGAHYAVQYVCENEWFLLHGVPTGDNFFVTFTRSADLALSSIAVKVNDIVKDLHGPINEIIPIHMQFMYKVYRDLINTVTGKPIANRETQTSDMAFNLHPRKPSSRAQEVVNLGKGIGNNNQNQDLEISRPEEFTDHLEEGTEVFEENLNRDDNYFVENTGIPEQREDTELLEENLNKEDDHYLCEKTGILKRNHSVLSEPESSISDEGINRKQRKFNKLKRVCGKKYTGRKRKYYETGKKEKPCKHSCISKSVRSYLCGSISEQKRKAVYDYFRDLTTWNAKKAYLKKLVRCRSPLKRRKTNKSENMCRKQLAYDYYLADDHNVTVKVCKTFFISTLNISSDTLSEWTKKLHRKKRTSNLNVKKRQSKIQRNPV